MLNCLFLFSIYLRLNQKYFSEGPTQDQRGSNPGCQYAWRHSQSLYQCATPPSQLNPYSAGINFTRQNLTSKAYPRTVRENIFIMAVHPSHRNSNESDSAKQDIYDYFKLRKKPLISMVYTKVFQNYKDWECSYSNILNTLNKKLLQRKKNSKININTLISWLTNISALSG